MAKSKEEKPEVPKSKLDLVLEKLNKDYGQGSIIMLDQKVTGDYDVISTGSFGFDAALGVGGLARGRVMELIGWEGTGKSTICGHLAANCQKNGGLVAYIDGEHSVDLHYFQALGVDVSKMLFSPAGLR
jgi:recombination protein RecA